MQQAISCMWGVAYEKKLKAKESNSKEKEVTFQKK